MFDLNDLTKEEVVTYIQMLLDKLNEFDMVIGDIPVSEQISIVLDKAADKYHLHEQYVSIDEFNKLKNIVENLADLVGDISVSDQISMAINNK